MFMDNPKIVGRTINGFKTEGPLSYQLRMYYYGEPFYCGATLISSKYAITAYHCIVSRYHLRFFQQLPHQNLG